MEELFCYEALICLACRWMQQGLVWQTNMH